MDEGLARGETHLALGRDRQHLESRNHRPEARCAQANMATIFAMSKLAESRDDDTGKHLERVQIYCRIIEARVATLCRAVCTQIAIDTDLPSPMGSA